jgi:Ice-binding-like
MKLALPLTAALLAVSNMGCGDKSSDHSPTAPTGTHVIAGVEGERLRTTSAVGPPLGVATTFGLVAASTATNTGVTTLITGDLGVSPGNTAPGFTGANVTGVIHLADGPATAAQADATTAYGALAGQPCNIDLTGQDLGGLTLTPGVYCFSSSAQLTGTLTLDGLGNPGSVWVFKIGSTLTTASGSGVVFINSGRACGTFWQVGSSATLGTTTNFGGNVLALASITLNTGANNNGALFALTAAVTLDTSQVTAVGSCGGGAQPSPTPLPTPPPPVPALPSVAAWGLLVILLASGVFMLGRRS